MITELAYWEDVAARYKFALEQICLGEIDFLYEAQRIAREALSATQSFSAVESPK